ncbi:MAG: ankyrin repeat domain-containing protein [Thermoanaerobaculia bacterium]
MKIRILASIALALAVLAAAAFWTLTTLPRARPESPLEKMAAAGSPEELRRELRIRGGVNALDPHGFTPLDWAARTGKTEAIRELVLDGADPDLRDRGPNGWTPLHHAVHKGQLGAVRALLASGAHPNGRSDNGLTPLMLASAQGEPGIVKELLEAGADPRLHGPIRWTALEQAVANGHPKVVDVLLRKDPGLRLGNGPRAWVIRTLARVQGHAEVLDRIDRGREAAR